MENQKYLLQEQVFAIEINLLRERICLIFLSGKKIDIKFAKEFTIFYKNLFAKKLI